MVFGVSSSDPLTFATVALLLLAVDLTASYSPARRATKVNPMVTLRYEWVSGLGCQVSGYREQGTEERSRGRSANTGLASSLILYHYSFSPPPGPLPRRREENRWAKSLPLATGVARLTPLLSKEGAGVVVAKD
jgi:hypothetical protein